MWHTISKIYFITNSFYSEQEYFLASIKRILLSNKLCDLMIRFQDKHFFQGMKSYKKKTHMSSKNYSKLACCFNEMSTSSNEIYVFNNKRNPQ